MLKHCLNIKTLPPSIYKLTQDDDESTQQLKSVLQEFSFKSNFLSSSSEGKEKTKKIELKLTKMNPTKSNGLEVQVDNLESENKMNPEEDVSKVFFEKFEMAQVSPETVYYKGHKTVMLSFNMISDQKARNKLMCLHAQILSKYVSQFSKKLEKLY